MRPVKSAHLFTEAKRRKKEKFSQTACFLPGQNRCAHHTGTGWKWALQNHQAGFGVAIPGQDLKVDREDCWRLTSVKYSNCNFPPKIQDGDGNVKEKRNTSNFKIMSWCIFFTYIASGQIRVFPIWTSREVLGCRTGERQCQTDGVGHQNWAGIWKITGCPNSRIAEADGVIGVLRGAGHGEINHNVSAQRHQWESVNIKFGTEKIN